MHLPFIFEKSTINEVNGCCGKQIVLELHLCAPCSASHELVILQIRIRCYRLAGFVLAGAHLMFVYCVLPT